MVISFGPTIYSVCLLYVQEDFYSNGDVTITGEGLRILTYAGHLWPLSSAGSLACHTYCHTGHLHRGHFLGPVALTPIAEHLAVQLSLPVLTT